MFNQLTLAGNVGKGGCEMRFTPVGKEVGSFSVAVNHQYKNGAGETVKEVAWVRVTVWGNLAKVCSQYLAQGSKVLVVGRLQADPATGGPKIFTRQDGTPGANFECVAETVRFLSNAPSGGQHEEHTEATQQSSGAPQEDPEIPF